VIEILEPGPLTSVQTASGRPGWRHLGVPVGGAADAWSARLANRLVGNPDDAALLEITLAGPTLRVRAASRIAMTGSPFQASIDGAVMPPFTARDLTPGSTLRIGDGAGARAYLAFGGGIEVEPVLGSAATDLRTGFGGHEGRALRAGDAVAVGLTIGNALRWTGTRHGGPIRVVAGPHADRLAPDALVASAWTVSPAADRTGVRLDGHPLRPDGSGVPSTALPIGAIQVPPDGRPIVMLADRPVTGGYPVPACVVGADVGRVAQLRPGDELQFALVSLAEARDANRRAEEDLSALADAGAPPDDVLGWAGALE
jgi:biotin-dependent carboxylase-like uncharacterized protein